MHKVLLILASTFILTSCAKKADDPAVQFDEDIYSEIDTSDIKQEPNYPEQPLPNTGDTDNPDLNGIAPLEIKTSSGANYWVKIDEANTNQHVVSYFIRSGETLNVQMPLGSYSIKYATGQKWYGPEYLFGDDTAYSKADNLFNFESNGYETNGYTLELIMQENGNLQTENIDKGQF